MHLPRPGPRSRMLAVGYGIILFFWLSIEDTALWPVIVLGTGAAVLISVLLILDKMGGRWLPAHRVPPGLSLAGAISGLGAGLAVAVLMFFKNARHAHVFPDYPTAMMLAVLERSPIWAVAGGLIGLSLGLGWLGLRGTDDE